MTRRALRISAPALALAAAALLPFLGKAFTIDDTLFLKQAEHLLVDPLHPTAFEQVWSESLGPMRMSAIMPSGPAMAYLLVPCLLGGGAEWIAHLTQLLVFGLGILATAMLALRFGLDDAGARTAAILVAATPVALAMASTAMPDVPAAAFGALGVERLLAWRDDRRKRQGVAAAVLIAVALLSRPHVAGLLVVAALALAPGFPSWSGLYRLPRGAWIPLVAAPLLALSAALATADPAAPAAAFAGAARTLSSLAYLRRNALAFAAHWSLVIPLALPWAVLRWKTLFRRPLPYVGTVVAALLLWVGGEARFLFPVAPAAGVGIAVLGEILADGWRRRDRTAAVLGIWLLIALPVVPYLHLPSKYLLASAPAAAILVARELSASPGRLPKAVLAATLAAGLSLGALIVRADAAFAGLGRQAASELIAPRVAAGERVWFAGHWGFQWYAERAGARAVSSRLPLPGRGDLVVSSLNSLGSAIQSFPRRELLAELEDRAPGGRIMSPRLGAGFYSNLWGYLPWAWGDDVLDRYSLWRLE